ncbi:uncharacterized protein LOC110634287, partial [Hevea brasiliensis]|uniref:uncharacterized protein LOC110634287 n=1 Tax=Hevea brasiliensis TaxID=3981 RepID=UPI0025D5440A
CAKSNGNSFVSQWFLNLSVLLSTFCLSFFKKLYFLLQVTEVRDFAGQEIEVKKLVDAESKKAAEKARAPAPSAVDAVLQQIKKKPTLNVLDKSKKDWGEFKEETKGLEEELDAYKKSSNQYLDKVSFLQRADYREFERERDARLAVQARRRTDMREDDF